MRAIVEQIEIWTENGPSIATAVIPFRPVRAPMLTWSGPIPTELDLISRRMFEATAWRREHAASATITETEEEMT